MKSVLLGYPDLSVSAGMRTPEVVCHEGRRIVFTVSMLTCPPIILTFNSHIFHQLLLCCTLVSPLLKLFRLILSSFTRVVSTWVWKHGSFQKSFLYGIAVKKKHTFGNFIFKIVHLKKKKSELCFQWAWVGILTLSPLKFTEERTESAFKHLFFFFFFIKCHKTFQT